MSGSGVAANQLGLLSPCTVGTGEYHGGSGVGSFFKVGMGRGNDRVAVDGYAGSKKLAWARVAGC